MSLPQNRNRTYAASSQVFSADLNKLQDMAIDAFRGKQSVISPSSISGTQNNWDPTGLDIDVGGGTYLPAAQVIRVSLSANANIHGIARGVAGRLLELVLVSSGGFHLDLVDEQTSSTAANRLLLPGGVQRRLYGDGARALLWYDGTSARWRVISVDTNAGDHDLETMVISPFLGEHAAGSGEANWSFSESGGYLSAAGGGGAYQTRAVPISGLLVGARIEEVHATVRGNAGGILTMSVHRSDVGGVTDLGSDDTTAAATDQGLSVTGMTEIVEIGESYYIKFKSDTLDLGYRIYEIRVKFRRRGKDGA